MPAGMRRMHGSDAAGEVLQGFAGFGFVTLDRAARGKIRRAVESAASGPMRTRAGGFSAPEIIISHAFIVRSGFNRDGTGMMTKRLGGDV